MFLIAFAPMSNRGNVGGFFPFWLGMPRQALRWWRVGGRVFLAAPHAPPAGRLPQAITRQIGQFRYKNRKTREHFRPVGDILEYTFESYLARKNFRVIVTRGVRR